MATEKTAITGYLSINFIKETAKGNSRHPSNKGNGCSALNLRERIFMKI